MQCLCRTQDLAKASYNRGSGDEPPSSRRQGGLGAMAPAANEFLQFLRKKSLILAHFFIENGLA